MYDLTENTSKHDFYRSLIDNALEKKHHKKETIYTYNTYLAAKEIKKGLKHLIKLFKHSHKKVLKQYIKESKQGIDNVNTICLSRVLRDCVDFYIEELAIISEDIIECEIWSNTLTNKELAMFYDDYDRRVIERRRNE